MGGTDPEQKAQEKIVQMGRRPMDTFNPYRETRRLNQLEREKQPSSAPQNLFAKMPKSTTHSPTVYGTNTLTMMPNFNIYLTENRGS